MPKIEKSIYKLYYTSMESRKNLPYIKEGRVIRNSVSSYLYGNPNIEKFLDILEPLCDEMISLPQKIKVWSNWAVDKENKNLY